MKDKHVRRGKFTDHPRKIPHSYKDSTNSSSIGININKSGHECLI